MAIVVVAAAVVLSSCLMMGLRCLHSHVFSLFWLNVFFQLNLL